MLVSFGTRALSLSCTVQTPQVYLYIACVLRVTTLQAAAARQPGRAYAKLVASGLLADSITEQLAVLGIDDASGAGSWVSVGLHQATACLPLCKTVF